MASDTMTCPACMSPEDRRKQKPQAQGVIRLNFASVDRRMYLNSMWFLLGIQSLLLGLSVGWLAWV
ncbi:hypothetical protein BDZ45DRAFT_307483 [Acephala macrosclerotiorum]|nr:hypothetical protein BDZ45DRAFT_307483 [Acephala macrosclerotiorum]